MPHRIIEWFGLEGTLKIIWFQPPCHEQGLLLPDQGAQSSVQPGLEHCQGGVKSLETFQARLDGALSTLIQLKMSLLTAGGWARWPLKVPSNPTASRDSMKSCYGYLLQL